MQEGTHVHTIGRRSILLPIFLFGLLFMTTGIIHLKYGSPAMTWAELLAAIFSNTEVDLHRTIVWEMRIPRIVLGFLVGTMLGAAGTMMQGAMNNKLAGPELLGISSGASLAMAAITVLHLPISVLVHPVVALIGGLLGGFSVVLASRGSRGTVGMLLIGMSVSAILNGLLIILIALGTSNDVNLLYTYLLGSLANRNWSHVLRMLPWTAAVLPLAFHFTRTLNVLQLGDEAAAGLGVQVQRSRLMILVLCTGLVAITVAQCGPIGYVALLAPHSIRSMVGSDDNRLVLPLSALCGGILLMTADTVARLLLYPMEIPVGVWTTLLGGAFFLFFFIKRQGGGVNA
ncbi:ABC transporter permease [Paenibacillus sp. FSL H8-0548]|uniref:FecCD family ABC transporter permease n=1 Tax=Paenibacillus sp. FSL H8-0548 TaxID=1920422 RepID=UPI00096D2CC5|nr:iron ABC transporter permease [Paenibacillus sp. FSL H8-0548]OMF38722.1 ABC transporter permease [Paenibacillus sp. FSL H8-0548]